jgi:hypothetical protein
MSTFYVKKDGSGTHQTIQSAIYAAAAGDEIVIEAGQFDENIDLYKAVKLTGAGMTSTSVVGSNKVSVVKSAVRVANSNVLQISTGTAGLEKGRIISGTGIPTNTRIAQVNPTSVVLSANATTNGTSNVTMAHQNDATMRVRGNGAGSLISGIKIVGYNGPVPENSTTEYAAVYFRNTGLGAVAAANWEMANCHIEAVGEYALLTDFAAGVADINIHDCKITGKTFLGSNPGIGNQFSVPNVPRQLVVFQSVNTGLMQFKDNIVEGITGGLTVDSVPSFNTAITIDTLNAVVTGNTINGTHGYGYALRVRNTATVENNINYSIPPNTNSGFLIGPTGSQVSGLVVGSNTSISASMVTVSQPVAGQPVAIEMSKELVKSISKVAADPVFSDEANWHLVTFIFKKQGSSKRLVSAFRDFDAEKSMKLRPGMLTGDVFELHKVIISKPDRSLLVVKRSEIEGVSSFDFTLA